MACRGPWRVLEECVQRQGGLFRVYGQASVGPTLALRWAVCGSVVGTVWEEAKAQMGKALAS